jgi:hypothetical protein
MTGKAKKASGVQKRRAASKQRSNRPLLIAGGVVLVVLAAAVIAIALGGNQPAVAEPATEPVVVSGTPLPEFPASGTDPAIGQPLPTLTGTDMTGAPMTIGPDGRATAIVVLAHWCPHCQAEVPQLVSWLAANPPPAGVDIVGVSTAVNPSRGNYPPSAWLSNEGWTAPTLNDDATLTAYTTLGGPNFPGFVFVTADGAVYLRASGGMDVSEFGAILEEIAP